MVMFFTIIYTTCTLVGAGVLSLLAYKIYQFITLFLVVPSPEVQLQNYKHDASTDPDKISWALITGSSGGIGLGYAHHLLSLNFGVIILAHVESEVKAAESKLRETFPDGEIKCVVMNCQTATSKQVEGLVKGIEEEEMEVRILINNVGGIPMAYPHFRLFADFAVQGIDNHFDMNARFMTHLTRLMLPQLTRNAAPRSLILNMTSASYIGLPYLSMYSATKAYMRGFSHALSRELKLESKPLDCLLIVPGDVLSDGNCVAVEAGSPDAKTYARYVLERVDGAIERGLLEISPWWKHALQIMVIGWLPESIAGPEMTKIAVLKKEGWAKEEAAEEEEKKKKR